MFSTAQLELINGYVASMSASGYKYYVAYQNSNNSSSEPDIYIYFSKKEIFATDLYRFTIPRGSLKYSVYSGNSYSTSTYKYPRVSVEAVETSEVGLELDEYVHISTNSTFTNTGYIQPDYTLTEVQNNETSGGILLVFCVFVFLYSFLHLFRR